VASLPAGKLSTIEIEVIREIRAMRASPGDGLNASLLESAARAAHHFILDSHGNVQLRLATIAREFGAEMRTLERAFFDEYRMTMAECQVEARLAHSKRLLSIFPPAKISAVAPWLQRRARLQPILQKAHAPVTKGMEQKGTRENRQKRRATIARLRRCRSFIAASLGTEINSSAFILSLSANRFLLHLGMGSVRLASQLDSWCLRS